jgi:TPR repeat protein
MHCLYINITIKMGGLQSTAKLKADADNGNIDAQYQMAKKYKNSDIESCIKYLKMAAIQGNKNAAFNLGFLYHSGILKIDKYMRRSDKKYINHSEALEWYYIAESQEGIDRMKLFIYNKKDQIDKQDMIIHKMNKEDSLALYKVGIAYIIGSRHRRGGDIYDPFKHGITSINIDHKKGIKLLEQSAKQHNKGAAEQLGYIYGYQRLHKILDNASFYGYQEQKNVLNNASVNVEIDLKKSYDYFNIAGNIIENGKIAAILKIDIGAINKLKQDMEISKSVAINEIQLLRQEIEVLKNNGSQPLYSVGDPPSYQDANI